MRPATASVPLANAIDQHLQETHQLRPAIEHHEIAVHGTLRTWARSRRNDLTDLLQQTFLGRGARSRPGSDGHR